MEKSEIKEKNKENTQKEKKILELLNKTNNQGEISVLFDFQKRKKKGFNHND